MDMISMRFCMVSTHSHPKVAASRTVKKTNIFRFQHTATRRWLLQSKRALIYPFMFQHTATRRWLHQIKNEKGQLLGVSTHSHPKVAANTSGNFLFPFGCFNTQPPEGGCLKKRYLFMLNIMFQHTATRRWLLPT